ncbi:MAG TPA: hypothetical protein VFW65_32030 [Pseudonocardiaceae bacterium]|nr:hypothetical protein [Pseudonocardiaceae bacterium]
MSAPPEGIAPAALLLLQPHLTTAAPDGYVVDLHRRYDAVIGDEYVTVRLYPRDVDPDGFDFGKPGGIAYITWQDGRGYRLHVWTTIVAYTFQQAGHVVTFPDPVTVAATAAWVLRAEIEGQRRG